MRKKTTALQSDMANNRVEGDDIRGNGVAEESTMRGESLEIRPRNGRNSPRGRDFCIPSRKMLGRHVSRQTNFKFMQLLPSKKVSQVGEGEKNLRGEPGT